MNEVLCKRLCHNLYFPIQSMREPNLEPRFYQAA